MCAYAVAVQHHYLPLRRLGLPQEVSAVRTVLRDAGRCHLVSVVNHIRTCSRFGGGVKLCWLMTRLLRLLGELCALQIDTSVGIGLGECDESSEAPKRFLNEVASSFNADPAECVVQGHVGAARDLLLGSGEGLEDIASDV